jgi:hypothetical protein
MTDGRHRPRSLQGGAGRAVQAGYSTARPVSGRQRVPARWLSAVPVPSRDAPFDRLARQEHPRKRPPRPSAVDSEMGHFRKSRHGNRDLFRCTGNRCRFCLRAANETCRTPVSYRQRWCPRRAYIAKINDIFFAGAICPRNSTQVHPDLLQWGGTIMDRRSTLAWISTERNLPNIGGRRAPIEGAAGIGRSTMGL